MSRWVAAVGTLCVLASGAARAADHARSAPAGHRGASSAAAENAPLLVREPSSGAIVRIWSRSDGFSTKIAWARNDGTGWSAPHDLTFGPGIDREPAVTVTSTGAWLFWRDERGDVFYAPLDLASGRLFGVPAPLFPGGVRGTLHTEGGSDAPVVLYNCEPDATGCIQARPSQPPTVPGMPNPGSPRLEGGSDAPVTVTTATSSGPNLATAADPTCERSFVSLAQGSSLLVAELDGAGRVRGHRSVRIGKDVKVAEAGPSAARFFMTQTCGN